MKDLLNEIGKTKIVFFFIILLLFIGSTIGAFTITDETWKMVSAIASPSSAVIETIFSLSVVIKLNINLNKTVVSQKTTIKNLQMEINNSITNQSSELNINSNNNITGNTINNYNGVLPKKLKESDYKFHEIIIENMEVFKQKYDNDWIDQSWTLSSKDENGNIAYGDYEEFIIVKHLLEQQSTVFSNPVIEEKAKNLKKMMRKYWNDLSINSQTYGLENAKIDLHFSIPYCIYEHPSLYEDFVHRKITQKDLDRAAEIEKLLNDDGENIFKAYDEFLKTFLEYSD